MPGEFRWLVADGSGNELNFIDGGWAVAPERWNDPAIGTLLDGLLSQFPGSWSLALPGKLRAAIVEFPELEAEELEQATRWQAEKLFHVPAAQLATDYEALTAIVEDPNNSQSLLVSLHQATVDSWFADLGAMEHPPQRVEPVFTACIRALRIAQRGPECDVFVHADRSGGTLLIVDQGRLIYTRSLPPDPEDTLTEYTPVFAGELGVRCLLASLLDCEDRRPHLEINGLGAFGDIDAEWTRQAASATQIAALTRPGLPAGIPETLAEHDRWLIPLGTLFGGLQ